MNSCGRLSSLYNQKKDVNAQMKRSRAAKVDADVVVWCSTRVASPFPDVNKGRDLPRRHIINCAITRSISFLVLCVHLLFDLVTTDNTREGGLFLFFRR